jgi:transposase InsO family protein
MGNKMRYTPAEKMEIIRLVENSDLPVKKTLDGLGVARTSFYRWYNNYVEKGYDGLSGNGRTPNRFWNKIPDSEREWIRDISLSDGNIDKSPRELAAFITDKKGYFISESSVYRILRSYDLITSPHYIVIKASDRFKDPTKRINEMWQTDFTYFKIQGWGWYFLSTVLDDYSRYILSWRLYSTMAAEDVQDTLDMAIEFTGIDKVKVSHRPRLLSDNGPCYLSSKLSEYLIDKQMKHTRGRPYHPQTQGKIERYHRTLKNRIKLYNYWSVEELEREISPFIEYYNNERVHESLKNVTPADMYYGRQEKILSLRDKIKQKTLEARKRSNLSQSPCLA